jgi:hypothetical protein
MAVRVLAQIPAMVIHALAGPRMGVTRRRRVTMISRCCHRSVEGCASAAQALTSGDVPRRSAQELAVAGEVVHSQHAHKGGGLCVAWGLRRAVAPGGLVVAARGAGADSHGRSAVG